ncbi:ABC transporter substrate-binding protein [Tessaracoccus antarcticus]|uniref:Extracellular solute-binding protein n=1 Tax=Tessaracoccus antarcticus TaxID=2479848 RepID=A0A3M0G1Y5_9ACTN|nr:extracellular solute-binding protein [Tessaracoccus antarcticus]RMB58970.1 extracellular solute-binding protein [Tessaracoccus antarcticus]
MSHSPRIRLAAVAASVALLAMAGCSGGDATPEPGSSTTGAETPSGEILVLTNRTDIVDTTFQDYKKTFEAKYPDVKVKFEALTDYEGEVKTRMNTKEYGDVLLIPSTVQQADYPDFFEPLGTTDELGKTYRFINEAAVDGTVYGIATFGNANGMVYNKDVFKAAGITEMPKTSEEFMADLQAVKDKTDAIPLYTNYKDGWPLGWPQSLMGSVSGDAEALVKMADDKSPWDDGKEKATLDSMLFDVVKAGLTEQDPTTTNWENSKNLIGTGKIAVMPLGTWALAQMQEAATKAGADPKSIGYMPPPVQVDGTFVSPIGGDFKMAININSEHKAAARAWIDWMGNESGYSDEVGGLSPLIDHPAPTALKEFEATGVKYLEMTPAPKLSTVDNKAEIGLSSPDYYRELVDAARGASGKSKEDIFKSLNEKWGAAVESVG